MTRCGNSSLESNAADVLSRDFVTLEERTLGRVLARQASKFGDKTLITSVSGESVSYRELDQVSTRMAHGLAKLGVNFHEPVLVMLPDVIDYIRLWCALSKRGAIEVPVNVTYRGRILTHVFNDSTARTIVVDRQYLDRVEEIADDLEHLERCIIYSEDSVERTNLQLPPRLAARCSAEPFACLFSEETSPFEPMPAFHDLTLIIYTSGTTGPSKGVMVTHAHAFVEADVCAHELFSLESGDVSYSGGLPLFHIAGLTLFYQSVIAGSSMVLRKGYKNDYFWPDIAAHGCTVVGLIGAVGNFLWRQPPSAGDAKTPLRKVAMFPLIPEYRDFADRFGVEISTSYGSTECPSPIVILANEAPPSVRCVGRPRREMDVRIFDENDQERPIGELGEICIRPKNNWEMMPGYWKRPDATAKAFRNFWYHTGDAGYQDAEGRFYFVDRLSDSIRRRGENVSSMEVEDEINSHPQVLECAVFPVWAKESEQEIMAAIVPKTGEAIDPVGLIRYLNRRMPYFMVPRYLEFASELAKTPSGKIQKYALRENGVTLRTWDRVAVGLTLER